MNNQERKSKYVSYDVKLTNKIINGIERINFKSFGKSIIYSVFTIPFTLLRKLLFWIGATLGPWFVVTMIPIIFITAFWIILMILGQGDNIRDWNDMMSSYLWKGELFDGTSSWRVHLLIGVIIAFFNFNSFIEG